MLFLFSFRISSPRLLSIDTHSCCHNGHFFFFPFVFFFSSLTSQTAAASQLKGSTSRGAAVVGHLTATFGKKKGPSQFEDTLKRSRQMSEGLQNLSLDSSGEGEDWGGIPKNPPKPLPLGADGATVGEGQAVGQSGAS